MSKICFVCSFDCDTEVDLKYTDEDTYRFQRDNDESTSINIRRFPHPKQLERFGFEWDNYIKAYCLTVCKACRGVFHSLVALFLYNNIYLHYDSISIKKCFGIDTCLKCLEKCSSYEFHVNTGIAVYIAPLYCHFKSEGLSFFKLKLCENCYLSFFGILVEFICNHKIDTYKVLSLVFNPTGLGLQESRNILDEVHKNLIFVGPKNLECIKKDKLYEYVRKFRNDHSHNGVVFIKKIFKNSYLEYDLEQIFRKKIANKKSIFEKLAKNEEIQKARIEVPKIEDEWEIVSYSKRKNKKKIQNK